MKFARFSFKSLALAVGLAFSSIAQATLTLADGTVFNGFVSGSGSSYLLTLRMDFTNTVSGSEFLGDQIEAWSLQLPGAAISTLVSAPVDPNWTVYNTGKAVGGNNGCGAGAVNTVCVDRVDNTALHGSGPLVTNTFFDWVLNITFVSPQAFTSGGNFHLLTVAWDDKPGVRNDGWKKDAELVSANLGVFLTCVPNPAGGGCTPPPPSCEASSAGVGCNPPPPPPPPPSCEFNLTGGQCIPPPPPPPSCEANLAAVGCNPAPPPPPGQPVPEPGSLALLGMGALAAGAFRRRLLKPSGGKA